MSDETLEQMKADFVADSSETLDKLAQRLSELDRRGPFPRDLVDELLRSAHSLRGTAGMFGLDGASTVATSFENLLEAVRSGKAGVTPDFVDLAIEVLDALGLVLRERPGDRSGAEAAVRKIEAFLGTAVTDSGPEQQSVGAAGAVAPEAKPVALSVKVDIALLDSIINTVSGLFSAKLALAAITKRLPRQSATRKSADDLLKVSLLLDKRLLELQSSVIDARLVPVSILFHRFRAEVRRLARLAGKDVELVCEGESTRIDRAVLDRLYDPLLHIIRNAVGHGIEGRDERSRCGKPSVGRIVLGAGQEASHVRIDIEDDGRGIDLKAVKSVAAAKGFPAADTDSALEILFRPGFTTKVKQDDISGRGVGLDAVRTQVEALRGMVTVGTQPGKGTKFSLWVPLTLAMSRGMLIEEGSTPVAVPIGSVIEVARLTEEAADQAAQTGRIDHKGGKVIVLGLAEILRNRRASVPRLIVIMGIGDTRRGVLVERVSGEVEIVARPLPEIMTVPGLITGATELHDGRPAIVVQPEEILRTDRVIDLRPDGADGPQSAPMTGVKVRRVPDRALTAVLFRRGGCLYAVAMEAVEEVLPPCCVTELAAAGDLWEGIFFVRGVCYGLLKVQGAGPRSQGAKSKMITLRFPAQCGIWADEAIGDCEVGPSEIVLAWEDDRSPVATLGTFARRGETVRILYPAGAPQGMAGYRAVGAAGARPDGAPKPLMQVCCPDDNHRGSNR